MGETYQYHEKIIGKMIGMSVYDIPILVL
jgi:hypothetical protein